jgi:hypothetical protein
MADDSTLAQTRRALHGVAELLLAGPQHAASGTIRLRPLRGGFGTVATPDVRVEGTAVVAGERRVEIGGSTPRQLAQALGIEPHDPSKLYHDSSGVSLDDVLDVDVEAADVIATAYALGDDALKTFGADAGGSAGSTSGDVTPVLWPEHFDLGITVDEVNYGVSPGDGGVPVPYMYVGPWKPPAIDDYWNQPYGAARELPDSADEIVAFFEESRRRLAQ